MEDERPIVELGMRARFLTTGYIGTVVQVKTLNGTVTRVRVRWDLGCWGEYSPAYFEFSEPEKEHRPRCPKDHHKLLIYDNGMGMWFCDIHGYVMDHEIVTTL